jgi:hypothetical protein
MIIKLEIHPSEKKGMRPNANPSIQDKPIEAPESQPTNTHDAHTQP